MGEQRAIACSTCIVVGIELELQLLIVLPVLYILASLVAIITKGMGLPNNVPPPYWYQYRTILPVCD